MSSVLAKKHESLATAKEIMDSLKGMFGQPEWSLRHEAIKYIYTKHMKEGTSVRELVLDMMMHFNIVEVNGGAIDEANQVSFILESLSKSFIPFQTDVSLNKIEFNLTTLLNELQRFQNLTKGRVTLKVGTGEMVSAKASQNLFRARTFGPGGPMNVKARGGYKYFISFIDDYSRYGHVYLIQNKSDSFEKFKEYKVEVENESEHGIQSQLFTPNMPQQNGGSERRNRTLLDMVRSMMSFAQLPDSFWEYALETAIYILNNVPSKSVSETPYELWKRRKGSLRYSKESRGGLFYDPQETKVFVSKNATFLEEDHIRNHQTRSKLVLEEISKNATDRPSSSTKIVDKTRNIGQTHPSQELREPRRSRRVVRQPDHYLGLSKAQIIIPDDGIEDPLTYKQTMNDVDCDQWIKAIDLKMESMYSNSVWTLVDQLSEVRPIGCRWIYKRKRDQAGKVQTFKARLVAKGYTQNEGIDYEETFSPVTMIKSIRILLSIATFYDYEIWHMDVKTAFLNGNLEESIYMVQSEGFIQKGQEQKNVDEPCVYKRIINSNVAFLVLYVDDILLIGNDVGHLTDIKEWLATQFQMNDLENALYVPGIQIVRNRKNKTLAISQTSYIDKMLSRYKMQNSKKGLLPYRYGIHLSKEQCPKTPQEVEDMSNIPYASAVGSLMHAMLCTRPDICYSVEIVSRYQSNPGRDHWTTVKNILKYLRRTKDYMLVYGSKDLILTGYTDSNFQTDKDARKSTSRSVFTLNGGAVV
ncbi:gag/pol protein [Cucumis melo var. makuwa]|uniref:Gag/pol protein n=1 Tax=Cucumis melo var. makuwa TaxID=1194695 RepID=A0A5A7SKC9_CUCMM|nr:gag/pol protein [Cucumis melo var. makuwa]